MKKLLYAIALCSLLPHQSCNNSESAVKTPLLEFEALPSKDLHGLLVKMPGDTVLYDPRSLLILDTVAICYDNMGTTGYSAINLSSGALARSFAYAGSSGREYNLNAVTTKRLDYKRRSFALFQLNPPSRITINDLDSILNNGNYKPDYHIQFPKGLNFTDVILLNDSIVVGKLRFLKGDKSLYGIFNTNSKQLTTGGTLPVLPGDEYAHYYDSIYYPWTNAMMGGEMGIRPGSNNELVYFSGKGAMFQILKLNGNTLSIINEKLYSLPAFKVVKQGANSFSTRLLENCQNGFNGIALTQDRIFALYNGKPSASSNNSDLLTNTILVYDWTGKPIEKIKLDQMCYSISIDPGHPEYLYGLRSFDSLGIYQYQIPK